MIKIAKPFKACKPQNISQGFFPGQHEAIDVAGMYGEFLVAPFNAKVANVVSASPLSNSTDDLRRGYGVRLVSIEDPSISVSYWHCLAVFPVEKGDLVNQGQIVAQMGNSGFVLSNGKYVEIDIRLIPPFPGTHAHISFGQTDGGGGYKNLDMSKFIDWSIEVKYDLLLTIKVMLQNIINLLNKK